MKAITANMIHNTAIIIALIMVSTFILCSKVLLLFLPKKVSVVPPSALTPEELPGWNNTTSIIKIAQIDIMISNAILSPPCHILLKRLPSTAKSISKMFILLSLTVFITTFLKKHSHCIITNGFFQLFFNTF